MRVHIQDHQGDWRETTLDKILQHIGTMEPLLVGSQPEYDLLWSMQLMIGREFKILLQEKDNPTDLPVSHIKIDIPL